MFSAPIRRFMLWTTHAGLCVKGICIGVMLLALDLPNTGFGAHGLSAIGHGVTVTL